MIKAYERLPLRIKAMKFNGSEKDIQKAKKWLKKNFIEDGLGVEEMRYDEIRIKTVEGPFICSPGEYIIKGPKGDFSICDPETFKQTYKEVSDV